MEYNKVLSKKQREQIFKLFIENYKLKFNEIEKATGIRSNEAAYHLNYLIKEGIIMKDGEDYIVTKEAEKYLPFLTNRSLNPLPVALVAVMNGDEILLVKRKRRPFKDYWCMIGGKMYADETIEEASLRLVKEKAHVEGKFESLNEIMHERILDKGKVKHSFMQFFTKIKAKSKFFESQTGEEFKWFKPSELKEKFVVPSDFMLIKNNLNTRKEILRFDMSDVNGKLTIKKVGYK